MDYMLNALTRSRTPEFHRGTLLTLVITAVCLYVLWEPIRPAREGTADILATVASQIRR